MYRRSLLPLAFLVLAPSLTYAQQGASAEIPSTPINNPITITVNRPLQFGTIMRGGTSSVASTSSSAATFVVDGDQGRNVLITIPSSVSLITMSGVGGVMTVALDRASVRANTIETQQGATVIDASSGSATAALSGDLSGNGTADGLGQVYLWIGGSVTASPTQQRGQYVGSFTVVASYVN